MKVSSPSPPADAKLQGEVNEEERLKQIAKRKEQNRNAQRRLRERKEEYTMQLEAQVAELHRRSQNQEEHSHYLREMLERIRIENQVLSQQLVMLSNSPETLHRTSINAAMLTANVVPPFTTGRPRHSSESDAASSQGPGLYAPAAPAQQLGPSGPALHGNIARAQTHAQPQAIVGLAAANGSAFPTLLHPKAASIARPPEAGAASPQHDHGPRKASSPLESVSDAGLSPRAARRGLNRYGSGQTEITVPSEGSDAEGPAAKMRCIGFDRADGGAMEVDSLDAGAGIAQQASASLADSMYSRGLQEHRQAATTNADQCMHSWLTSGVEPQQDLMLANMSSKDFPTHAAPIGATPGALGLTSHTDGWTISPWVSFTASPTGQAGSQPPPRADGHVGNLEPSECPTSLATRRGFSGKLQLQPPNLQ